MFLRLYLSFKNIKVHNHKSRVKLYHLFSQLRMSEPFRADALSLKWLLKAQKTRVFYFPNFPISMYY